MVVNQKQFHTNSTIQILAEAVNVLLINARKLFITKIIIITIFSFIWRKIIKIAFIDKTLQSHANNVNALSVNTHLN